jgi:Zn-finger nucleic acid-binding protein
MRCPVCKKTLVRTSRQGIEIDYCQSCLGVWLNRGELEKILENSLKNPEKPIHASSKKTDRFQVYPPPEAGHQRLFFQSLFDLD